MRTLTLSALLALLLMMLAGCGTGVLIGNVKPVDEKSESYGVMDLTKGNPDWIKLDPKSGDIRTRPKSRTSLFSPRARQRSFL